MKDPNHAIDTLARKLNLPALSFQDDQLGIDVTPDLTIFLTRLDDDAIEASCALEMLDFPDAAMMQAMLEANFLGGATGPGRLALSADSAQVILCECWMLGELDAPALESRWDSFATAAGFWQGEGTALLLEQAEMIRADQAGEQPFDGPEDGGMLLRL